jgi:hypothetical protein
MKTQLFAGLAAVATLALAAPAFAVTGANQGEVDLTGTVTAKCSDTGTSPVLLNLGELAKSDGTVVTNFAQNTSANLTFACTSAKVQLNVSATPLTDATLTPGGGYTNRVDYTATATATTTTGADTADAAAYSTVALAPNATATTNLNGPLATSTNNVNVVVGSPSATGRLMASLNYTGAVTVTVSPGT